MKRAKNIGSKNSRNLSTQFFLLYNRRSAIAQRQKDEENLKGKLTAEENKRQVRTSPMRKHLWHIRFSERTSGKRI